MQDFNRKLYAPSTNITYMWRAQQPYMKLNAERNILQDLSTAVEGAPYIQEVVRA